MKLVNTPPKTNRIVLVAIAAIFVVIAVIGYNVLNAQDKRSTGEKISDAVNELPNGVDKAARQLEERTPANKLEDAIKDTGDSIKKSTNQQ
ncbi:MAG: hypothetical protein ACOYK8_08265 [Alphaproteobacteria bacterium]